MVKITAMTSGVTRKGLGFGKLIRCKPGDPAFRTDVSLRWLKISQLFMTINLTVKERVIQLYMRGINCGKLVDNIRKARPYFFNLNL